jgi:hypothetical protein
MLYKWIQKAVNKAVSEYLSRLPDEIIVSVASKIIGAQGLTEQNYKKLIESASGERVITIYFGNGDYATISNNKNTAKQGGPGW